VSSYLHSTTFVNKYLTVNHMKIMQIRKGATQKHERYPLVSKPNEITQSTQHCFPCSLHCWWINLEWTNLQGLAKNYIPDMFCSFLSNRLELQSVILHVRVAIPYTHITSYILAFTVF